MAIITITPPHLSGRQEALDRPISMEKLRKVTAADSVTLAQLLASQRYLEANSNGFDHIKTTGVSMLLLRFWLDAINASSIIDMVSWPYGKAMGHSLYTGSISTSAVPPSEVPDTDPVDQTPDAGITWREIDGVAVPSFDTDPTVGWRPAIGSSAVGFASFALVDVGDAAAFSVRINSLTAATGAIVGVSVVS